MANETMLDRLILNKMTSDQYKSAKEAGTLSDTELYLVDDGGDAGFIPAPTTAKVGQTIKVSAIDANGKPTAWEAADFPSGGGGSGEFPLLAEIILTEEVSTITIDKDMNGNPLEVSEIYLACALRGGAANANASNATLYFNNINTAVQRHNLKNQLIPAAGEDTSVMNNQRASVFRYQKLKYGYLGPGAVESTSNIICAPYRCFNAAEWHGFVDDKFRAITIYCETSGYTFGIGSKIRLYGR